MRRDIIEEVEVFSKTIKEIYGFSSNSKSALREINRFDQSFLEDEELQAIQQELYRASDILRPLAERLKRVLLKSLNDYEAPLT